MENRILSLKNITKTYPGVIALDNVSIDFIEGEVHALLGENGAGKSTLIKSISGAIAPDSGIIEVNGKDYKGMTPLEAKQNGIEVIYQEFNLVESLSAAENIFLGEKIGKTVNQKEINKRAQKLFDEFHLNLDPSTEVERLTPAKKQIVEICKAISKDVKILIMDEPSAPLSTAEVDIMFEIIENLKKQGVTIIYITHRLEEIFRISDRVTILRDGCYIKTINTADTDRKELVSLMVGREFKESYPVRKQEAENIVLQIKNLSGNGVEDISFNVKAGEILGFAGLVGAGRTEMANVIYGAVPKESGQIFIKGKEVIIKSPSDAIKNGIGLIPEDRKELGCLQEASIRFNITISCIKEISKFLKVNATKEKDLVHKYEKRLRIKTPSVEQEVQNLSGGNQQKVVLAKTLAANPDILIFDEPTRGIDVGAKQEIYQLMNELAEEGKALIMISSDMEELLGMSNRIIVIHEGRCTGEVMKDEFDPKLVIGYASGMTREEIQC